MIMRREMLIPGGRLGRSSTSKNVVYRIILLNKRVGMCFIVETAGAGFLMPEAFPVANQIMIIWDGVRKLLHFKNLLRMAV